MDNRRPADHCGAANDADSGVGVNKTTPSFYFHRLRQLIAQNLGYFAPLDSEVAVDESYFGGRHKGKRGRGAGGKVPVFGLLKRHGWVYATMIADVKGETLPPITEQKHGAKSEAGQHCLLGQLARLQCA